MRFISFLIALALSIGWIALLNRPIGGTPALGRLLNPVNGYFANAEPADEVGQSFYLPREKLKQAVTVTFDTRLVPHIKAQNDEDLYFAQGYAHAYYRLWQMDMQTRAAAGRISEVAGPKAFDFDRNQRRKGMVWAAENSLKAMEANPYTKKILDAYTHGVNTYIQSLSFKSYPLEYKLMSFSPEPWTNLKCALLLKYMADDLTGGSDDIAMTYLRTALPPEELDHLFPDKITGSQPVIPAGTRFVPASKPIPATPPGELFSHFDTARAKVSAMRSNIAPRAASGIGSNNWALNGKRSTSGAALLCNDPHLGLNLPSIWYELQLTAAGVNCYGVSIPGAPGIVIGFNDHISWGFTNNYRDVKDFYEIRSEDPRLYYFDGKEVPFNVRYEKIYTKGEEQPFIDTIRFSIHGPLMYDEHFPEPSGSGKTLAMTWMAHRATNELLSLYLLNRANDYDQFVQAIRHFECPAQNFIYADRTGNIALWGQGRFINKWKDQGKFVMRGDISATLWGDTIPMRENPQVFNPPQNYLASANQAVTDNTYPYWYNGDFTEFRSWAIHHFLQDTLKKDVPEMMALQNNSWSYLADQLYPLLQAQQVIGGNWDEQYSPESKTALAFQLTWLRLYTNIWQDEFENIPDRLYPSAETTMQLLLEDTASRYYDDIHTPVREHLRDMVQRSYKEASDSIKALEKAGQTEWYQVKNTSVNHLAKLPAFSYANLKTSGWGNTINAMKQNHGPSWRMIVSLQQDKITAYGVYPGGQSGNPGSRYYAAFLDYWVTGKYYTLNFNPAK